MFEYEWGNPSTILFPPTTTPDHDHNHDHDLSNPTPAFHHHHHHHHRQPAENPFSAGDITSFIPPPFLPHPNNNSYNHHSLHSIMDPRGFHTASSYQPNAPPTTIPPMLPSSDFDSSAFFTLPKPEPGASGFEYSNNNNNNNSSGSSDVEIGLNLGLGGRTYFSAADEDFLSRLYRRSRPFDGGIGGSLAANSPKCQAEGCNADLSNAKHYHRRHKVCEFHSKASTVVAGGLTQRFCQQCSRFHLLTEFDNGKRSCRRRLADHNRRRRKSHQQSTAATQDRRPSDNAGNSSSCSENPPRSPSESRAQSVSSATAASSPMQESKPVCYNTSVASPSVSPSSIFY